jgi:predicted nucleotidyltransferase
MSVQIDIDRGKLAEFCQKWQITELALFGSVLREDFRPDSDVDVLVTFAPDSRWTLFDILHAEEELSKIVGRKVEIGERSAIEQSDNYIIRKQILSTARTVYAA